MNAQSIRAKRVADSLRAYLTEALSRDIGDPRLARVVVTDVGLPDDLSIARVSVRLLGADDADARRDVMEGLNRAASRLRKAIGPKLRLRRVPELRFSYDAGHDAALRVETLLKEIADEAKNRS